MKSVKPRGGGGGREWIPPILYKIRFESLRALKLGTVIDLQKFYPKIEISFLIFYYDKGHKLHGKVINLHFGAI